MGDKTCAPFFCGYEQHFSPTLNLNYLLRALPCSVAFVQKIMYMNISGVIVLAPERLILFVFPWNFRDVDM